jgi:hypothetical protein
MMLVNMSRVGQGAALGAVATGVWTITFELAAADSARRARMTEVLVIARSDAQALATALRGSLGWLVDVSSNSNNFGFVGPTTISFDSRFMQPTQVPAVSISTSASLRNRLTIMTNAYSNIEQSAKKSWQRLQSQSQTCYLDGYSMSKGRKKQNPPRRRRPATVANAASPNHWPGSAADHGALVNNRVHIFVDDQNLFWGIVNKQEGRSFRIDFGRLLLAAARDSGGQARGVGTAYVAGVIPDDDSFWAVAKNQGFTVRRGYLGSNNRSKQDDAYLITDLVTTLYEEDGPSTIVVVAGDADYMPPLLKAVAKGWRTEVAFISSGLSGALDPVVHEFRKLTAGEIELFGELP